MIFTFVIISVSSSFKLYRSFNNSLANFGSDALNNGIWIAVVIVFKLSSLSDI